MTSPRGSELRRTSSAMTERAQILVFTALTLLVSWTYEAFIVVQGGVATFGLAGLLVLMWIPGLLSILMRLALGLGFRDVGLTLGKPRFYAYAVIIPLALAVLTSLVCALLDIRQLAFIESHQLGRVVPLLLMMLAFGLIGALGEELGWRGFLLPKMISAGVSHPYLSSGLIWAVWHLPLIAFGGYYHTDRIIATTVAYGLSIVALNFVISELRVRAQSVWVATCFHAAHNFFFQLAVPSLAFTRPGARSDLWEVIGGDSGLVVAALYAVAFLFLQRLGQQRSGL